MYDILPTSISHDHHQTHAINIMYIFCILYTFSIITTIHIKRRLAHARNLDYRDYSHYVDSL
jgi:hypothetical protein